MVVQDVQDAYYQYYYILVVIVSERMNLHLSILCLILCLQFSMSEYSKLSFVEVPEQITNIINCKTSSNAIYTTQNNKINLWVPADQKVDSYDLTTSMSQSKHHYLECSKYGSNLDNAYIAVLDVDGNLTVWEEVNSAFRLYLYNIGFKVLRTNDTITDISIGQKFLAVGYKNQKIIDIYNIYEKDNISTTIPVENEWKSMKMDILGNLALLTILNDKVQFQYYTFTQNRSVVYEVLVVATNLLPQQVSNIDYEWAEQDQLKLVFMISGVTKTGRIELNNKNQLSDYKVLDLNTGKIVRLCDNKFTFVSGKQVIKVQDGTIIKTDYQILNYACTTDTGKYLYSQFYVVSAQNNVYYIDCFYDGNTILEFVVWACFVCCCFWIRLCAQTGCRCNGCRELGPCLEFVFGLFCWCPTHSNIDRIKQSFQF